MFQMYEKWKWFLLQNWVTMGAACSSVGAVTANLIKEDGNVEGIATTTYKCQCLTKEQGSTTVNCLLFIWRCPRISWVMRICMAVCECGCIVWMDELYINLQRCSLKRFILCALWIVANVKNVPRDTMMKVRFHN